METIRVGIMYGNLSLHKLCRKNPITSVVGWYKMSFMVYLELVLVWKEISGENGQNWPFMFLFDTPTPRRRSALLGVELCLGRGHYA